MFIIYKIVVVMTIKVLKNIIYNNIYRDKANICHDNYNIGLYHIILDRY